MCTANIDTYIYMVYCIQCIYVCEFTVSMEYASFHQNDTCCLKEEMQFEHTKND